MQRVLAELVAWQGSTLTHWHTVSADAPVACICNVRVLVVAPRVSSRVAHHIPTFSQKNQPAKIRPSKYCSEKIGQPKFPNQSCVKHRDLEFWLVFRLWR